MFNGSSFHSLSRNTMKPIIAVVGLRHGPPQHVEDKCNRLADLKFLRATATRTHMPKCDHIILMTKFSAAHLDLERLRSVPRDRVHTHPGGTSSLIERIEQISVAFHAEEGKVVDWPRATPGGDNGGRRTPRLIGMDRGVADGDGSAATAQFRFGRAGINPSRPPRFAGKAPV